ncbi:MAG TPA: glycosyltransferase [Gemmatales bacterium]|nr:glycosyltransferase [Gemmatales bacterium]
MEGAVSDHALRGWLARAAALIVPSVHEGFGLPIVEGLAAGVPVLVARAGASPATLGDAGLSFEPDDPVDLAATLRRVLQPTVSPRPTGRFAIVSPRWGRGFAGGAERSLATIARTLVDLGRSVEVFTTCNEHDHLWRDTLPAGTTQVDGLPVHRYPCDPTDTEAFQTACAEIRRRSGRVASEVEAAYLAHSLGSEPLVAALCQRRQEFDAILVGPYLFRLTWQVATAAPEQTLVLPCFHDEPFARLAAFRQTYSRSAALICHSEPELHFMTEHLGLNHPRSYVVGTTLSEKAGTGEAARGQARLDSDYLVYCGRWSAEKGADKLTAWMSALHARQPGRVRLVVMGGGSRVPTAPWLVNLGFVDEATKRDVLAGARALVQLSPNESLSLVVLECWAEGRPVIVDRASAVLAWQVARSGGGWAVGSAEEFEAAAMACLDEPVEAQRRGGLGQQLARREYQDTAAFGVRWETILEDLRRPLAAIMSERGPCRAERFTEAHWRPRWLEILGRLRTRPRSRRVELRLPTQVEARPDDQAITVPVRVCHRGTATLAADGPGRHCFFLQMRDPSGRRLGKPQRHSLRQPLLPGQEAAIALPLPVPSVPGQYEVEVWIGRRLRRRKQRPQRRGTSTILIVSHAVAETSSAPALRTARRLLAQAQERHQLPDDYVDVTEGRGASLKRYIKRKLLNNLRRAYIDVLSRQQSEVNADLINCLGLVLEQMELLEQEVARLRRERGRSAPRRPRRRSSSQEKEVLP